MHAGEPNRSAGREMACCPATGEKLNVGKREKTVHTKPFLDVTHIKESNGCGTIVQPHKPIVPGLCGWGTCEQMTTMAHPFQDFQYPY